MACKRQLWFDSNEKKLRTAFLAAFLYVLKRTNTVTSYQSFFFLYFVSDTRYHVFYNNNFIKYVRVSASIPMTIHFDWQHTSPRQPCCGNCGECAVIIIIILIGSEVINIKLYLVQIQRHRAWLCVSLVRPQL